MIGFLLVSLTYLSCEAFCFSHKPLRLHAPYHYNPLCRRIDSHDGLHELLLLQEKYPLWRFTFLHSSKGGSDKSSVDKTKNSPGPSKQKKKKEFVQDIDKRLKIIPNDNNPSNDQSSSRSQKSGVGKARNFRRRKYRKSKQTTTSSMKEQTYSSNTVKANNMKRNEGNKMENPSPLSDDLGNSLLPPHIQQNKQKGPHGDEKVASPISWNEVLDSNTSNDGESKNGGRTGQRKARSSAKNRNKLKRNRNISDQLGNRRPSSLLRSNTGKDSESSVASSMPSLDGVLPVSELFYRSKNDISSTQSGGKQGDRIGNGISSKIDGKSKGNSNVGQNRKIIITNNNRVNVKQNESTSQRDKTIDSNKQTRSKTIDNRNFKADLEKKIRSNRDLKQKRYKNPGKQKEDLGGKRQLVRRGMEMRVGGQAINADPPKRVVLLHYCRKTAETLANTSTDIDALDEEQSNEDRSEPKQSKLSYKSSKRVKISDTGMENSNSVTNWADIITTNTRDFGPILHEPSVQKVSSLSRGLYCEHFVVNSMKWKVCPKDLEALIKSYQLGRAEQDKLFGMYNNKTQRKDEKNSDARLTSNFDGTANVDAVSKNENIGVQKKEIEKQKSGVGFMQSKNAQKSEAEYVFTLGGELNFNLGVTRAEIEVGNDSGSSGHIIRRVLSKGISVATGAENMGFNVAISNLLLNELDSGSTEFNVEFNMMPKNKMEYATVERLGMKINTALARAMDNGEIAVAMGAAAKEEEAWPLSIREKVVEEFLFSEQDEEQDKSKEENTIDKMDDFETFREETFESYGDDDESIRVPDEKAYDGPFGMPGDTIYAEDDIFLGGGNDGVFFDYSKKSIASAPFKGALGPLLLDAVVQRALQRQPRVIAIGDVHGCFDELQMLLRKCDYRPGDLIVFLGDLVSKGPDSTSVVKMARELGAIGVRGNHDFEVVRWYQAIKSGADPPSFKSEHFSIASSLDKADLKWLYSLPWYINSVELGALFVHAGFVSGIKLAKQNPRLMMNMRSILPDGTVTSKFFNNWPWARLWDGPQTVLFGHDADRGLQQYEHAIGLDTGCVYGGRLTACILPEKRLISVNAKREYFRFRRKQFD